MLLYRESHAVSDGELVLQICRCDFNLRPSICVARADLRQEMSSGWCGRIKHLWAHEAFDVTSSFIWNPAQGPITLLWSALSDFSAAICMRHAAVAKRGCRSLRLRSPSHGFLLTIDLLSCMSFIDEILLVCRFMTVFTRAINQTLPAYHKATFEIRWSRFTQSTQTGC